MNIPVELDAITAASTRMANDLAIPDPHLRETCRLLRDLANVVYRLSDDSSVSASQPAVNDTHSALIEQASRKILTHRRIFLHLTRICADAIRSGEYHLMLDQLNTIKEISESQLQTLDRFLMID